MTTDAQKMRDYGYVPAVDGSDCEGSFLRREARREQPDAMPSLSADSETKPGHVLPVRGNSARTLSDRALVLIDGPRQDDYASPDVNLSRIGGMWSIILGLPEAIPAWRVALMMSALKIARAAHKPTEDSVVDAVGYLELVERLRP